MMECLQLQHTFEGREKALRYVQKLATLESSKEYVYKLHHAYDIEPTDVYIQTSIQPPVFELVLAYILFEGSKIDECYAIGQEEIDRPILAALYGAEIVSPVPHYDEEMNLYYVWEKWCGLYNQVMALEVLKKAGVQEALTKIIQA